MNRSRATNVTSAVASTLLCLSMTATSAFAEPKVRTAEYFHLTKDTRTCTTPAGPGCGGYFVTTLNTSVNVVCPNGQIGSRCYIGAIDTRTTGGLSPFDAAGETVVKGLIGPGRVVEGVPDGSLFIENVFAPVGDTRANLGHHLYVITDNGMTCGNGPCLRYTSRLANRGQGGTASSFDFSKIEMTAAQSRSFFEIVNGGQEALIQVGEGQQIQTPQGVDVRIGVNALYLPLAEKAPAYRSIFNRLNFTGWSGDSRFWSVQNGNIVGLISPENNLRGAKASSFLIWNTPVANFDLTMNYRLTPVKGGRGTEPFANSGVYFRADRVDTGEFALSGYQADIENGLNAQGGTSLDRYSGSVRRDTGAYALAERGQSTVVTTAANGNPVVEIAQTIGDPAALTEEINRGDWNRIRIRADGNVIRVWINDRLMSRVADQRNESSGSRTSGSLGLQVHNGNKYMKVEYNEVMLKNLP